MAIGQARNEFVQRSQGKNICHKASYIDRDRVFFEGTKFQEARTYDYSNREAPLAKRIMLPEGVSEKFKDPTVLWNAAEKSENRHDSQVGMELVIALPDDKIITKENRIELTERFAQQFVDKGLAAHYAIHIPDFKDHNWHAHILVPTRTFSKDGQSLHLLKDRTMQQELANTRWGEVWTNMQNDYFKENELSLRVDARAITPQEHLGPVRLRANCLEMLQRHEEIKALNTLEASDPAKILSFLTNSKSIFQSEDVERFMSKHTPIEKLEEVKEKFWKQEALISLQTYKDGLYPGFKDIGKFTTLDVIEEEKQIIRRCDKINEITHVKIKPDCSATKYLNTPQTQVFSALSGREGIAILQGYAGTGKSHILEALKNAYEEKGFTVRGFGPDNATANLLKDRGFNAENVPRFLYAEHHGHRSIESKELWVVDEAGKLGNQSLNELTRLAHRNKARLILAGDAGQMPSVERGGMFQALSRRYTTIEITDIQRQKTPEQKEIAQNFAEGKIQEAIEGLHKAGGIKFERDKVTAVEKLIIDWSFFHYKNPEKTYDKSLILASTNREVNVLNQAAHDVRMAKNELGKEEYSCKTSFGNVRVSIGDLIEFRKNDRDLSVTNGMKGELISSKEDRFTVKIYEKDKVIKMVSFDPKEYGFWQLGYATTTFRSQGRTVENTYVLHSPNNSKQTAYVAMTRHQNSVQCYVSEEECKDISALEKQISKDSSKETTLSYNNEYDLTKASEKHHFERKIWQDKSYGGRWKTICAYGRELKKGVQDFVDHHKEKSQDKTNTNDFYDKSICKNVNETFGATKLPDLEIYKIKDQAMSPISRDIEKMAEQEKINQSLMERQQLQQEKFNDYQERCQTMGSSQIEGIERIFKAENQRSIIVLCASDDASEKASHTFKEAGFIFLSVGNSNEREKYVDLTALEERKVLVWGDREERAKICENLMKHDDMHVKSTDHDFCKNPDRGGWFICQDSENIVGSWKEVDKQDKELDKQLGLDKGNDRCMELGR